MIAPVLTGLALLLPVFARAGAINAVSCSQSDVQTAVSAANSGDTVNVPACSAAWSAVTITKAIHLMGAGIGKTVITQTGALSYIPVAADVNNIFELAGFTFQGNSTHFDETGWGKTPPITGLKVHDNAFNGTTNGRAVYLDGLEFGVFYNNTFSGNFIHVSVIGAGIANGNFYPLCFGCASYPYFEDNAFGNGVGAEFVSETGQGGRMVMRHNTISGYDSGPGSEVFDIHGEQESGGWTATSEYYHNTVGVGPTPFRWMNHRGGQALIMNNTVSRLLDFNLTEYQAWGGNGICHAYPVAYNASERYCSPINGTCLEAQIHNSFYYNNVAGGSQQTPTLGNPDGGGCGSDPPWGDNQYIQKNREYWLPAFGLESALPATCTADGNTYYGTTDTDKIYKCAAANTWSLYYQPYAYPHPLRGGGDTTPPTVSITSPANGATVNGTITVSANASDNVAVQSVQFKLDGANLGSPVIAPPYQVFWDTTKASNGNHALTAVATDSSGNTTTSSAVNVTVNNVASGCSGSGISWSCAAGSAPADVNAAINASVDGAVITFANGSYAWPNGGSVQLNASKGTTLICAAGATCAVNTTGNAIVMPFFSGGANNHLYRMSGFTFNLSSNQYAIWFCSGGGCSGTFTQVRIDHNVFNVAPEGHAVLLGENASVTNFYGVMDHNTLNGTGSGMLIYLVGAVNKTPPPPSQGTANNFFVEDNAINLQSMSNAGEGCMDGWSSTMRVVYRHNTSLNCLVTTHGVNHNGGPDNVELYDNVIAVDTGAVAQGFGDGYRLFHHQGSGQFLSFNNVFANAPGSGKSGDPMEMAHYRDTKDGNTICDGTQSIDGNRQPTTTYYGYPCWRQPGRDTSGTYKPMYSWNNRWSDTGALITLTLQDFGGKVPPNCTPGKSGDCDYHAFHMLYDREAYNAVSKDAQTSKTSPFNGTTGMGFGTSANRPTTCATSSETAFGNGAGGVGYFATDDGPQGTLYTCSATNTWSVYYRPYTYPHPMAGGGGDTTPPTVAISSPTDGTTVSGSVIVSAIAGDNVGVASVQFQVDGVNLGQPVTQPPYQTIWDARKEKNNSQHILTAIASDAAGNKTSSTANVTVRRLISPNAEVPGLRDAFAYPNPALRKDPTLRAALGLVDSVEISIYDVAGRLVHSTTLPGQPTGVDDGGEYYYDYTWSGRSASGTYFAVIHGKKADGTTVRARIAFAVVR